MSDSQDSAPIGSGSDDALLYNLMAAMCPRLVLSPDFGGYTAPDNSPAARAARVAASKPPHQPT